MNSIEQFMEGMRGLSPDAIRDQIEHRDDEIRALRVLLRATMQAQRSQTHRLKLGQPDGDKLSAARPEQGGAKDGQ
jgi:hypothetical protein